MDTTTDSTEAYYQTNNNIQSDHLFIRVDGEVLTLLVKSGKDSFFENVKKGLIIGKVKSFDKEKVVIESTSSNEKGMINVTFLLGDHHFDFSIDDTLYQIVFKFDASRKDVHGTVISFFNFGSPNTFCVQEYGLAYFNYYNIIKERFTELKSGGDDTMQH